MKGARRLALLLALHGASGDAFNKETPEAEKDYRQRCQAQNVPGTNAFTLSSRSCFAYTKNIEEASMTAVKAYL
jgi:hypothetical protein